jgi:hypothetical protein
MNQIISYSNKYPKLIFQRCPALIAFRDYFRKKVSRVHAYSRHHPLSGTLTREEISLLENPRKKIRKRPFHGLNLTSFFHTKVFCAAFILQLAVCYLLAKINRHKSCLQDVVEIDFDYWTQFHQLFLSSFFSISLKNTNTNFS